MNHHYQWQLQKLIWIMGHHLRHSGRDIVASLALIGGFFWILPARRLGMTLDEPLRGNVDLTNPERDENMRTTAYLRRAAQRGPYRIRFIFERD